MNHKEFFVWLDGYLTGKLENKTIEIVPIIEKMSKVKGELDIDWTSLRKK